VERCTNHCAIATKRCALWLRVKRSPQIFLCGKLGKARRKKRSIQERKKIRTAELNRRDQVTATGPGPVSFERGNKVDYQVAAPTETSTPTMHRARIAQQRVRMEGWRQERLGSRAGTHREEEKNKNILTRKKERKKNILDTHQPSHGRTLRNQKSENFLY
jgi:hypothetical protein